MTDKILGQCDGCGYVGCTRFLALLVLSEEFDDWCSISGWEMLGLDCYNLKNGLLRIDKEYR